MKRLRASWSKLGQGDGADEEALAALQEALSEAQATLAHEREEEQTLKTGCAACEERVRALNARAETLSREVQVLMGRRQETGRAAQAAQGNAARL